MEQSFSAGLDALIARSRERGDDMGEVLADLEGSVDALKGELSEDA